MEETTLIEQLERTPLGTYVFSHEGMSIHDPLSSTCGRFRFDPGLEGSHSPAEYGFEVVRTEGARLSAWERRFKIGELDVVMQVTDESATTHAVAAGSEARFEVSVVEGGYQGRPLAVWYQQEGSFDDTPPKVVFGAPEDPTTVGEAVAEAKCPNCGDAIQGHKDNGCVLNLLMGVLRERGSLSEGRILELHAGCDADALWTSVGKVADSLEDGRFLWRD